VCELCYFRPPASARSLQALLACPLVSRSCCLVVTATLIKSMSAVVTAGSEHGGPECTRTRPCRECVLLLTITRLYLQHLFPHKFSCLLLAPRRPRAFRLVCVSMQYLLRRRHGACRAHRGRFELSLAFARLRFASSSVCPASHPVIPGRRPSARRPTVVLSSCVSHDHGAKKVYAELRRGPFKGRTRAGKGEYAVIFAMHPGPGGAEGGGAGSATQCAQGPHGRRGVCPQTHTCTSERHAHAAARPPNMHGLLLCMCLDETMPRVRCRWPCTTRGA
jgi:hypothetical protein